MKFIVLDDYYVREPNSTYAVRHTNTTLCDCYQEAYDKYTNLIDRHTAPYHPHEFEYRVPDKVKTEQTFRQSRGSCARCEFVSGLITSIQQLDHPKMETTIS